MLAMTFSAPPQRWQHSISAAKELRRLVSEGVLEARATRAVLVDAGHGEPGAPQGRRPQNPGGLSLGHFLESSLHWTRFWQCLARTSD